MLLPPWFLKALFALLALLLLLAALWFLVLRPKIVSSAVANSVPGGIVCVSPGPNGIVMGSTTVLIGNVPAARVGDLSMHGTPIAPGPGCPTVIIGG